MHLVLSVQIVDYSRYYILRIHHKKLFNQSEAVEQFSFCFLCHRLLLLNVKLENLEQIFGQISLEADMVLVI